MGAFKDLINKANESSEEEEKKKSFKDLVNTGNDERQREDIGKVAVTRGPIVYCLEQEDNGAQLHRIYLSGDVNFEAKWEPELLDGVVTLTCPGAVLEQNPPKPFNSTDTLYRRYVPATYKPKALRWVPYYSWANRSAGEMSVWVRIH